MFVIAYNGTHQVICNRQTATVTVPVTRKQLNFSEPQCLNL
jgi:hypothetical protein